MEHGGVKLHAVTINLIGSGAGVELGFHRKHHNVTRGRIVGSALSLVRLYGAEPSLLLYHAVKRSMGVHPLGIAQLRHLELV